VEYQTVLSNLKIGVVGLGSVGAVVAETLSRIGVTDILLLDADRIEEHNLDRLLHATAKNIGCFKVDVVAKNLRHSASASSFHVEAKRAWVQERDAYTAALDCDILFSAVDRPLPKDLLNNIAYVHNIPVIFGGIRVATKPNGRLGDAAWSVVRAGPGSRCLRCDGQYTSSDVVMEHDGSLSDSSYINQSAKKFENQNVFPFTINLGSLMVLEMIRAIIHEPWWGSSPTKLHYTFLSNKLTSKISTCLDGCSVVERTGEGDNWTYAFLDEPVIRKDSFLRILSSAIRRLLGK